MIDFPSTNRPIRVPEGGLVSRPSHDLLQISDIVRLADFAWRHRFRIVSCLGLALVAAGVYCAKSPRVSESTAQLLVVRKDPLSVGGIPTSALVRTNEISTHVALIGSPWLAERVVSKHGIRDLATFDGQDDPVRSVLKSLTITHQNKNDDVRYSANNILEFSFRGQHADECPIVVMAVVDAYRQYLQESNRDTNTDTVTLITQKTEKIRQELVEKEQAYNQFREQSPLFLSNNGGTLLSQQRFANIDNHLISLQVRRAEIQARLDALTAAAASAGVDEIALRALLPDRYKFETASLQAHLLPLLNKQLSDSAKYGPDHPEMLAIDEQIKLTRRLYSFASPESVSPVDGSDVGQTNPVAEYARSLEQELENVMSAEKLLEQQLVHEHASARTVAGFEIKDDHLRSAIARDQQFHDALIAQLQRVDLEMDSGGYSTTLIAPPSDPKQVAPRSVLVFAIAAFLGVAVGGVYALVVEASDSWTRESHELTHSLQLPLLGKIPWATTTAEASDGGGGHTPMLRPNLFAHRWPDSAIADAYRDLRTAIFLRAFQPGMKVVVVTSSDVGDGKSTSVANLAISFAQSGQKVLLIDGNLHAPVLHKLFGLANEDEGLTSVLGAGSELQDAIHATDIPRLSVMPSGRYPSRSADLLTPPRLKALFNTVREDFDCVLVDSPAMFEVTDAHILASCADGVLLVSGGDRNEGAAAQRAVDTLLHAGANVLGIAVNDTKSRRFHSVRARHFPNANVAESLDGLEPANGRQ